MGLFGIVWTYTEVTERVEYAAFKDDMAEFYDAGGRFTSADGAELSAKIDYLETRLTNHLIHSAEYSQMIDDMYNDIREIKAEIKK